MTRELSQFINTSLILRPYSFKQNKAKLTTKQKTYKAWMANKSSDFYVVKLGRRS